METLELTPAEWPVVTRSLLADHEKLAATHGDDQINQAVFSLIRARKALMDARLSILFARRFFPSNLPVRHRLESMAAALDTEHARFPLTILDNGGGHTRKPMFPQAEESDFVRGLMG